MNRKHAAICFQHFVKEVIKRDADVEPRKAIVGQSMKTIGNSSYGKTITNVFKHTDNKILPQEEAQQAVADAYFLKLCPVDKDETCFEVVFRKRSVLCDLPIQIGFFVYGYAKLKLLQFYYEFLDRYIPMKSFEMVQCDTESCYFALSEPSLRQAVKPELLDEFDAVVDQ